jgi:hypothetical protein
VYAQCQEELQCVVHLEALRNIGHMEEVEYQVHTIFHCCSHFLRDPKDVSKLTQMLTACMKLQGEETIITTSLP